MMILHNHFCFLFWKSVIFLSLMPLRPKCLNVGIIDNSYSEMGIIGLLGELSHLVELELMFRRGVHMMPR